MCTGLFLPNEADFTAAARRQCHCKDFIPPEASLHFNSTSPCLTFLFLVSLQNLATLPPPPEPADWSAVSINTDLYLGTIRSSVSGLIDKFQEELKRLYGKGVCTSCSSNATKLWLCGVFCPRFIGLKVVPIHYLQ